MPRDRGALGSYASGYPENRRNITDLYIYRITMVPAGRHPPLRLTLLFARLYLLLAIEMFGCRRRPGDRIGSY